MSVCVVCALAMVFWGDDDGNNSSTSLSHRTFACLLLVSHPTPQLACLFCSRRPICSTHTHTHTGGTNHHPGNKLYRKMVEDRKVNYINSKRLDKPLVALGIIKEWRGQDPPGRFLKVDDKTGFWNDVGDKKAREKTSQALREKAPILRKQQEEELTSQERKERGLPEVRRSLRVSTVGCLANLKCHATP